MILLDFMDNRRQNKIAVQKIYKNIPQAHSVLYIK